MTFKEAYEIIESTAKFGSILGLQRIEGLLEGLGNPEKDLKVIHIAGTNGKGSVSAFVSHILMAAGFKVGRYNSPSIFEYLERIRVNGDNISEDAFASYMDEVVKVMDKMEEKPTVFEIETAIAFMHFKATACDYVVLEVGLGGKLDSTNVIKKPLVSVITPVDYDHMYILGNTLAEIAGEKAGIIKRGCPVVVGHQQDEAMGVIVNTAVSMNAPVIFVNAHALSVSSHDLHGQTFSYEGLQDLHTRLIGDYQIFNAATAIEAVRVLKNSGAHITEEHMRSGIEDTVWHGRFELINEDPIIIVDGGHNPQGAKSIATTAMKVLKDKKIILVMGVFKDKDYTGMLEEVAGLSDTLITYSAEGDRGLQADTLAKEAENFFDEVIECEDVTQAIDAARIICDEDEAIIVFGTLSTIGKLFCHLNKRV